MTLSQLVESLPEIYQPIFGHPELSQSAARSCEDRLTSIVSIYEALQRELGRPLRLLDLGCAQGYFSHALAAVGAEVRGVDFLDRNIAVCKAIAKECPNHRVVFEVAKIEDVLKALTPGSYDLVLGLSVFHHMVQGSGITPVRELLGESGQKVLGGIFEMALADEPVHWAVAQARDPRDLLSHFAFVHEVARHDTHLSPFRRPLYFASNHYWFLDGQAGAFENWTASSNSVVPNAYGDSRRLYFDRKRIVKLYRLESGREPERTLEEWENETAFLQNPPRDFPVPKLNLFGRNQSETWLVRDALPGKTLAQLFALKRADYEPEKVLRDVLRQIVALEAAGLYHSDLRTWNVLIGPDGGASLIDYGAISRKRADCDWPHNIFVSFLIFMRETIDGKMEFPIPVRSTWLDPDALPEPFRQAVWRMLNAPIEKWRFSDLQHALESEERHRDKVTTVDRLAAATLLKALETASDRYRLHIEWLERELARAREERADLESKRHAAVGDREWFERELGAAIKLKDEFERELRQERERRAWFKEQHGLAVEAKDDLERQLYAERAERDIIERELQTERGARTELERQLSAFYTSTSWYLTAPLRTIVRGVRMILGDSK